MKKWSALLLAAFVFTIGPSVILAQEPAKPEKPKGLLTTVLTILTKSVESQTNSVSGANNLQADKDEVKKQDAPSTLPSSTPVQPSSAVVHILDGTQKTSPISESSVSNADKGAVSNSSVSETAQPPVKTEEIKPEVPAMTKEIRTPK